MGGIVKRRVNEGPLVTNRTELIERLIAIWHRDPEIKELVENALRECLSVTSLSSVTKEDQGNNMFFKSCNKVYFMHKMLFSTYLKKPCCLYCLFV